jgi:hypothetical protein
MKRGRQKHQDEKLKYTILRYGIKIHPTKIEKSK